MPFNCAHVLTRPPWARRLHAFHALPLVPSPPLTHHSAFTWVAGMISTAQPSHPPALDAPRRVALPSEGLLIPQLPPEGAGRLFFTARIERPLLYRGGSASKKNGLPAPSLSSEAARCASKRPTQPTLLTPSSECAPSCSFSFASTSHSPNAAESRWARAQPLSIRTPRCRQSCADCS